MTRRGVHHCGVLLKPLPCRRADRTNVESEGGDGDGGSFMEDGSYSYDLWSCSNHPPHAPTTLAATRRDSERPKPFTLVFYAQPASRGQRGEFTRFILLRVRWPDCSSCLHERQTHTGCETFTTEGNGE